MPSTPRRKPVTSRLAAPLLVLSLGACGDAPTSSVSETDSSGTSAGDDTTTAEQPTTSDPTGVPVDSEGRYFLRIDDEPVPPVRLEMDRAKVIEVFGEEATKQIKLLDVDSTPLLNDVLARIQSSCGTKWDDYIPVVDEKLPQDPMHDCASTELGMTYGPNWKTSPQYAMVRLLTMTPRNANVAGTSLGPLWTYFHDPKKHNNAFGLSFEDLLAASLFCDAADLNNCVKQLNSFDQADHPEFINKEKELHTRPFIPLDVLADTLKTTLMLSHPNIANPEGKLPVTLYDALNDMKPLADKFGPVGSHPGLLMHDDFDGDGVDEFTTRSDALTADFMMKAIADSNLRLVEGIDASQGAGSMFVSTKQGPCVDAPADDPKKECPIPLNFDFNDPDKVQILGIAANPIVDMRMRISELDIAVPSCDGSHGDNVAACKTNLPEAPLGGEKYIWGQPLWSLERIVAQAAYATYKDRSFSHCFIGDDPCDARVSIGAPPDPAGWSVFTVTIGVQPPKPQFFWELLLGVAQVAIHDFTGPDVNDVDKDLNKTEILPAANGQPEIKEGEANPVFALRNLSIGLTAEEMIAQIRPNLQEQADFIARVILGKFWKHNDRLDFYYRRATDTGGAPTLFFVAPGDPRPDPTNPDELDKSGGYANPGFFADEKLADKLSSTVLPGVADTEHEKLQLPEGDTTVYMQDDEGRTYRLRFFVPAGGDPTEIVVHVRPV